MPRLTYSPGYIGLRLINQVEFTTPVAKLNPELPRNVVVRRKPIKFATPKLAGLDGRLELIARIVTKLIKFERIEEKYHRAQEVQGYVERLIVEAMRYGDCHRPTMELADFWLKEKQLIHKLFKVLVPRYLNYSESFTTLHRLSPDYSLFFEKQKGGYYRHPQEIGVLELKGNPLPPIQKEPTKSNYWLTNVLLSSAKEEYEKNKNTEQKVTPRRDVYISKTVK
ncbi:hypothetical protein B4U79_09414 [Dinothrombium tinctorium]|uniref:Large ribosomal subunit protein bL17m n=1 Tax=Dinothrombium tinctorium TaxID=1965070 RepID=A0A3S4R2Z0_9ACAR|nr:hypothetical protein B4U79_05005 [Dinothrombium tinctorium]RWS10144.1 hypothetical protein B4U79_13732 [Dinothrombium tinctorium]RWS10718.1 hypothetical protein B4U79_07647 [Dinothrombium tinctorium]RWS10896.1 hypothetical protein B4U79_09414 [Dinothrombium tinctorium]